MFDSLISSHGGQAHPGLIQQFTGISDPDEVATPPWCLTLEIRVQDISLVGSPPVCRPQ
jgi:hypothetical protein